MKKISSFYVADRTTYEANIFTPTMNISTFTMNISTLSMNISTLSIKTILGSMLRSPLFFLFFLYAVTQFQGSCFAASSDNWSKETNLSKLAQMVRDARKVNSKLAEDINKHYIELYRKAIGTITVVDTAEVERLKNEISTLKAENSRLASELESQKDKLKNIDQLLGRADITPE